MGRLFSGLNQKRQGGKITSGTINIGSTKGRGSATRMVSHCKSNSENPSDCVNQVVSNTIPSKVNSPSVTGILFDKSTFYNLFDIDGSGRQPLLKPVDTNKYKKLPQPIINALIVGADRWAKFLSFDPSMVNLIRSFSSQLVGGSLKSWKGIMLGSFIIKEPEPPIIVNDVYPPVTLASCGAEYIDGLQTTMNYSFTLNINKDLFDYNNSQQVSQEYLNTLITHELGHALGFPIGKSYADGNPNNTELLPKYFEGSLSNYEANPRAYNKLYFPKAIEAYNSLGGWTSGISGDTTVNDFLPLSNDGADGPHLSISSYHSIENGSLNYVKFYRGFYNEIMIPYIEQNKPLYISQVSINVLRDLYTFWKGRKYYNYFYKGGNETTGRLYQNSTEAIEFS
jgi:hypothetical protein